MARRFARQMTTASRLTYGLAAVVLCLETTAAAIIIDGKREDWSDRPVLFEHPSPPASGQFIRRIRADHDDDAFYLCVELAEPANVQFLRDQTLSVYLDTDNNPATGAAAGNLPGSDLALMLSPVRAREGSDRRFGAGIVSWDSQQKTEIHSPYAIGVNLAPNYASDWVEVRIDRRSSLANISVSSSIRFGVALLSSEDANISATPGIHYALGPKPGASRKIEARRLTQPLDDGDIRTLVWNVSGPALYANAMRYGRLIRSIDPALVLLDEAPPDITVEVVQALLEPESGQDINVIIGPGGGRQKGVIASRYPLRRVAGLDRIGYDLATTRFVQRRGGPRMQRDAKTMQRDGMPVASAELDIGDQRIWVLVVDLQCCGFAGSVEDRFRVMQVETIARKLQQAIAAHGAPDGLIIAGDFNLVGSREPLDRMLKIATDWPQLRLTPAHPLQLDGHSDATYGVSGPFAPGRLDFVLFSAKSLKLRGEFVLDSRDLSPELANQLGVDLTDSLNTSEHLPVVVDLMPSPPDPSRVDSLAR